MDDAPSSVYTPVRSQTAFEETFERLGSAIRLGLLAPGAQLPAERELCGMLEVSRSTLRQALLALTQAGLIHAVRGRGGGTFVTGELPPVGPPSAELIAGWRDTCDLRLATDLAVAALATERAGRDQLEPLRDLVDEMREVTMPFERFRRLDVRFHVGLAELTQNDRLVVATTESQAAMSSLIAHISHPPEVLEHSNVQHERMLDGVAAGDREVVLATMAEHVLGTTHILAGLLGDTGADGSVKG